LHQVLKDVALLLAPFTPFLAESIWQTLKSESDAQSVHLAKWPAAKELTKEELNLLNSMEVVREAANVALNARKELSLPIRQPLARVSIKVKGDAQLSPELFAILASEINVKQLDDSLIESDKVKAYQGSKYLDGLHLDTELTPELKLEGLARSLERQVQDMRKKTGLKVGEMVTLSYDTDDEELRQAMSLFDRKKTFVNEIKAEKTEGMEPAEVDGRTIHLSIVK
jgi:isoleucyl-tRNA synthetase